nr:T9SS type A sorting domain-containing protein [Bacteroidota bacterium]
MKFQLIVLFTVFSGSLFSQAIPLQLFSSAGGNNEVHQCLNMNWAIGEIFVETLYSNSRILTQGFHQDASFYEPLVKIFDTNPSGQVDISVYPNPVSDILIIDISHERDWHDTYQVHIINLLGETILISKLSYHSQKINLSDLKPGTYLLTIQNLDESFTYKTKIVKK